MSRSLTESQKRDLAEATRVAWSAYEAEFDGSPNGTSRQLLALVELMDLDVLIRDLEKRAIARRRAEDQGVASKYVEPDVSPFLVEAPYDGCAGPECPGCWAPSGKRHGQWCPAND